MKLSSTWYALILIASALLLSADTSGSTREPNPRAVPQNHREATTQQKPASDYTDQAKANRPQADALAIATPSGPTDSKTPTSDAPITTDEERHWRIEEADQARSLQVEQRLFCVTLVLAIINALVMAIYFVTMLASIRATKAATSSAESYRKQLALQARPLLRVRQARVEAERPYIKVNYVLVNVGGSTAHVISLTHGLQVDLAPPNQFGEEPFDLAPGQKYMARLQAGGSHPREQPLPRPQAERSSHLSR